MFDVMEVSMVTEEETNAIGEFFAAAERLKQIGIIRSDKYLGDIAEFLCSKRLSMNLAESGRQPGHDGHLGDRRAQVKFHGGTSTTIDCGDPEQYDELLVVLGPKSVLRPPDVTQEFIIYRVPSSVVLQRNPHNDGRRRYTRAQLQADCQRCGSDV